MILSQRSSRVLAAALAALLLAASCSGGDDGAEPLADGGSDQSQAQGETVDSSTATGPDQDEAPTPGFDIDTVLAADPNCPTPVTGEPLRIGYAADFGEIGGFADRPGSQAALHLGKLINCSGGIDGVPVEVIVEDIWGEEGNPLTTRAAVKSLLDQGAHVLLGPPFPNPGFRILQQTKGEVAVFFTGSTEPALGNDASLSYLVCFNDTQGATAAAQFALTKGWNRAVTFSAQGPYFGYNPVVFRGVFEASGGQVLADYPFTPFDLTDEGHRAAMAEAAAEIATNPPDVIYTPMFAEQLVMLREELEAVGVTDVEFIQPDAFEATGGYFLPPEGTEGVYHATHTAPGDARTEALIESMRMTNGAEPESASFAALAGDAIAVIADAYLRVRTTDPKVLGEAVAEADGVQGITGVLSYNGTGLPTKPIYIHKVEDGQPTLAATIGG